MTRLHVHVLSLAVPTTLVVLMCCLDSTNAFAGLQHHIMTAAQHVHQHAHQHQHQHQNLNLHEIHDTAVLLQHSSAAFVKNLAHAYTNALQEHPLVTKMLTGGTLATAGDAVAQSQQQQQQSRSEAKKYDTRRATSFMVFDMAYRALQHVSFPIIVQHCHGQYLNALLTSVMALLTATATTTTTATGAAAATSAAGHLHHHLHDMMMMIFHPTQLQQQLHHHHHHHHHHVMLLSSDYLAAMEQTLVSQLFIVPFLYYPVFFALTGAVQKLTPQAALERAKDSFWPLMQRNLLFWIPVQFVQFGFIDEQLQIPFLSAAGLCWTFILSVYAGSTKQYSSDISSSSAEQPKVPDMSSLSEDDLVVIGESATTTSSSDGIPSTGTADNRATVTL